MFELDRWQEIWETMSKNKLRTFLTAFGVFWGIFMLVLLLGAGKGMQNGIQGEFAGEAVNGMWINPGRTTMPHKGMKPGRWIKFTNEDLATIRRDVPEAKIIAPRNRLFGEYTINYKAKNGSYQVFGIEPDFVLLNGEKLNSGRMLNYQDIAEKRKVIVIGEKVRKVLFGEEQDKGIGEYVRVSGVYFKVIGTFTSKANQGRNEERALTPFSTFQTTFNQMNSVHTIGLVPKDGIKAKVVEDKVKAILAQRHTFAVEDKQALWINNNEEQFEQFQGLFSGIEIFVWFVGGCTLIAGIIGVSNIMMIIVKERTKEIGIRKAIGATPASIVSQVIQESVVITGLSGYLGLFLGVGLLALISNVTKDIELPFFKQPTVDLYVVATSVVILVLSGALAGLMPALKAANVKPIEALNAD
ncbi:MAG: ABC transporter permease [Bacteroidetes bacterium]|nr:MAG: ABC transporter permease [Bacteroidota bacterium]